MKTKLILIIGALILSQVSTAQSASAQIMASPSFQDMGTVAAGQSRMTNVTFINMSSNHYQFVNVSCNGFGVFNCSSMCYQLMPHGSCSVMVTFSPRANDGMRQSVNLNLSGMGAFASATVYGTDARANTSESQEEPEAEVQE